MGENDPVARSPYFLVRAKPAKFADDPRFGLIVTKKTFRHAVDRNRAKRLLRDWIAHNDKMLSANMDYVFIARRAILDATRSDGRAALGRALNYMRREIRAMSEKSQNVTE